MNKRIVEGEDFELVSDVSDNFRGHAVHYRFNNPVNVTEDGVCDEEASTYPVTDIVVSSVESAFDTGLPETMIFEADESGKVVSFRDLVRTRDQDHENALNTFIQEYC